MNYKQQTITKLTVVAVAAVMMLILAVKAKNTIESHLVAHSVDVAATIANLK